MVPTDQPSAVLAGGLLLLKTSEWYGGSVWRSPLMTPDVLLGGGLLLLLGVGRAVCGGSS